MERNARYLTFQNVEPSVHTLTGSGPLSNGTSTLFLIVGKREERLLEDKDVLQGGRSFWMRVEEDAVRMGGDK